MAFTLNQTYIGHSKGSTSSPVEYYKNTSGTPTLLVVNLYWKREIGEPNGRTGGAPSWDGTEMQGGNRYGSQEGWSECFYLMNSDVTVGTATLLSVPNTSTIPHRIYITVSLWDAEGNITNIAEFGESGSQDYSIIGQEFVYSATSMSEGMIAVGGCGHGEQTLQTPTSGTELSFTNDGLHGFAFKSQYDIIGVDKRAYLWQSKVEGKFSGQALQIFEDDEIGPPTNTLPTISADTTGTPTFTIFNPSIEFTGSDDDGNTLKYAYEYADNVGLTGSTTRTSDGFAEEVGGQGTFLNEIDNPNTSPFTQAQRISFTHDIGTADELVDGTWYWRARCNDGQSPSGSWSDWTDVEDFIVDTSSNNKPTITGITANGTEFTGATKPRIEFTGSDLDGESLKYEFEYDTNSGFTSSTIKASDVYPYNFNNLTTTGDTNPFNEGDDMEFEYLTQDSLPNDDYWWRARCHDSIEWSDWTTPRWFTRYKAPPLYENWDTQSVNNIDYLSTIDWKSIHKLNTILIKAR